MTNTIVYILAFIPDKNDGLITAKHISKITGYIESFIRKQINIARMNGIPVCSTKHGYYLSRDYDDIADTINFLTHRLNTQLQAIEGLKSIIHKEN